MVASGLVLVAACGGSGMSDAAGVTNGTGEGCQESREGDEVFRCNGTGVVLTTQRGVDLLFVIDDGPESGALQARLADAIGQLATEVAAMDPAPELRVAFTSSRDANPLCEGPDGGAGRFVLASCRERPEAFVDVDGNDRFAELCDSRCEIDSLDTIPTSLDPDERKRPRPWLELSGGESNLANGDVADALRCGALLGVSGCPFPAPISATWYALLRSQQEEAQPEVGFLRADASLVIVWVTSGVECSLGPAGSEAFDGATPELCWNAGVACSDTDADGELSCAATDDPLLAPLGQLAELLEELSAARWWGARSGVSVLATTGVPPAWQPGPVPAHAPADPETAARYGVEPTCMLDDDALLPPVRHAALFARPELSDFDGALSSACTDDFAPLVTQIADTIASAVRPACMPRCIADSDLDVEGLQPQCNVIAEVPRDGGGLQAFDLVACIESDDGELSVPEGERACIVARTGAAMHEACRDEGWNLELEVVWDGPTPPGASVKAVCLESDDPGHDCPDL
jgi:hypothetical protein